MAIRTDLNLILDEGAPKSIAGVHSAAKFSDLIGVEFEKRKPDKIYFHEWGENCRETQKVIATRDLLVEDLHGKPTIFNFDIISDDASIVIGHDVKKFSDTMNKSDLSVVSITQFTDSSSRVFHTYISKYEDGNDRIGREILSHKTCSVSSLLEF